MNVVVILAIILSVALVVYVSGNRASKGSAKMRLPEIQNCNNITDIVMSVNQGRIYPYFTGMSFDQVKRVVKSSHRNFTDWENKVQLYELIGYMPSVDLPDVSRLINRTSIHLTKTKVVSAITIEIKDFQQNKTKLIEEMILKFGKPTSIDRQFMIWREGYMVVNIDATNGCISVINEKLF